jgi:cob(I)alamin adenosyltransferase
MKIYTKTGDDGTTSLIGATRVSKAEIKVDVYGTIDELNSYIGLTINFLEKEQYKDFLVQVQRTLFKVGIVFATDWHRFDASTRAINASDVAYLEAEIDRLSAILPPLDDFIIPGGTQAAAHTHVARTIARRAERLAVAYYNQLPLFYEPICDIPNNLMQPQSATHHNDNEMDYLELAIQYLNRLSDYLFTLSRIL